MMQPMTRPETTECDLALVGARVIDPETVLDGVRNVGVRDGRIVAVTDGPLDAHSVVDVDGRVLAPGFIDIHSHAQTLSGARLQALDGVTTALETEAGAWPVRRVYERTQAEGRPINYGFSASWALARIQLLDGLEPEGCLDAFAAHQAEGRHWRRPADAREIERLAGLLEEQVFAGALGLGILLGYAPEVDHGEYLRLAHLAEHLGVPTFTHARYMSSREPGSSLEGALEVLGAAAGTGAHMHLCHLNSTSNRMIDQVATTIDHARIQGLRVTTEAYPYGSASTVVGAAFLAPELLPRLGIGPENIIEVATGRRMSGEDELRRLRAESPGSLIVFEWLDEDDPTDLAVLARSVGLDDTAIASDAMPLVGPAGGAVPDAWPVIAQAYTHPRSAGCFARLFGWQVRQLGVMTLQEAVRRCTLLPAQMMAEAAPAFQHKGRVQVGCDADLVVFDPETIASRATFTEVVPSAGIEHVLVNGRFVVRGGALDPRALPGRPVYGRHRVA